MRALPALRSSSLLRPDELSALSQQAVNQLLREGESINTLWSYRSALKYWAAWFSLRYGEQIALPVSVSAVLQFIVDHAQRKTDAGLLHELPQALDEALVMASIKTRLGPLAFSTIEHRVAVLSKAHQSNAVSNPCADPKVRELLAKTRRAYAKRGVAPEKKEALTLALLRKVLDTCDNSLRGIRDRALLLFAWGSGGRRRSEVAAASMKFLTRTAEGEFSYELKHSKTNQSGRDLPENHKPVVGEAAEALQAWLEAAQISQGAIFRRIHRGNHVGDGLAAAAVREIVRKRCALAGVSGQFSSHSLRSGFISEAGSRGTPLADIMALSGHRNVQTVLGYTRAQGASQTAIARSLLSEGTKRAR